MKILILAIYIQEIMLYKDFSVITLHRSDPYIYLSLNIKEELVFYSETYVRPNENAGSWAEIIKSNVIIGKYNLLLNKRYICGNKSGFLYTRKDSKSIDCYWNIIKSFGTLQIKCNGLCLAFVNDQIHYANYHEWPAKLEPCRISNNQEYIMLSFEDMYF
ncbi:hypothetical protein TCON_1370 [Astathelohania contejeani]|uniref:Galectin n=1 Tax=Astathelohania contejeani TaxID=164912 RepID=A0ABQ7HZ44_9MICR|nr:hypothetical protein TCON_1370 [Thelohania contejeani]